MVTFLGENLGKKFSEFNAASTESDSNLCADAREPTFHSMMNTPETQQLFPDRLRLPLRFDAAKICGDVEKLDAIEWVHHYVKQNYLGTWSVIPLRAPATASHPVMMIYADPTSDSYVDTSFLDHVPSIRDALAIFQCQLRSVRLMKLTAGSMIKEHSDMQLSAEDGCARLHIPIRTNADVNFMLNGSRVVMEEGECWYLRLSDPHSVVNGGTSDRIHLVVDAVIDDWLLHVLNEACR